MKSKLIAVAIAGALSLGTLSVIAGEHEGRGHGGPGEMHRGMGNPLEHLSKQLDLTPAQQAQVAPIVDQAKPQLQAIHQEAMQKAKGVIENAAAQIRPLLTPEQQTKFDALKKAHEDMINAAKEMHKAQAQ